MRAWLNRSPSSGASRHLRLGECAAFVLLPQAGEGETAAPQSPLSRLRERVGVRALRLRLYPAITYIVSHCAARAGFSAPSISTATSLVISHSLAERRVAAVSLKRPRTRAPARTGAIKRMRSKP